MLTALYIVMVVTVIIPYYIEGKTPAVLKTGNNNKHSSSNNSNNELNK